MYCGQISCYLTVTRAHLLDHTSYVRPFVELMWTADWTAGDGFLKQDTVYFSQLSCLRTKVNDWPFLYDFKSKMSFRTVLMWFKGFHLKYAACKRALEQASVNILQRICKRSQKGTLFLLRSFLLFNGYANCLIRDATNIKFHTRMSCCLFLRFMDSLLCL